ncbi:alkylmercury lyase [Ornithinimicrobium sp. CNJ-824]|uniref:thioredoxin family protein n=1 Tax=Ornithinimicrobium sp. CNJ-824 TaxID=1904966 RepID=UPI000967D3DA|nr:thioredoxin family protein [Ornithinimicrobium sp. CNJ-824]OLT21099.1 alkylmercury lyase [Ornithinimicrobium sp. CNJ-824]
MDVCLLYYEDCPNWKVTHRRLVAIAAEHPEVVLRRQRVETLEQAEQLGFRGSPTVLVDGADAFSAPESAAGLSCRVYPTADGLAGAPTTEQLYAALGLAQETTR